MSRIIVTGASGFIGRHTLRPLLERGFDVHVLSRSRPEGDVAARISWHEVDLLDADATEAAVSKVGATHLLHLAWYAEHGKFWEARENLDWVEATSRLLESFHVAGGSRAVFAGTCAEYDWTEDCCSEATPLVPATLYGASKNALREIVEAYATSTGLSAAWGRVFFTYGPGEQPTRVIASVAQALVAGESVPCSEGTQLRDFLYVEDLGAAFAALADGVVEGAVDIGSGSSLALREVLLRLEALAGRKDLVRLGEAAARSEPARIVADTSRLRSELGWQPSYTLDEGLERTLAWWREGANVA
jgi:nucleoside-diphosphate-sugar epimerase